MPHLRDKARSKKARRKKARDTDRLIVLSPEGPTSPSRHSGESVTAYKKRVNKLRAEYWRKWQHQRDKAKQAGRLK